MRTGNIALPLGLMGGAALVPEEAEGAVRPDILDVVKNALKGERYGRLPAGTLESPAAKATLLSDNGKYRKNEGHFTQHGLISRAEKDGWSADEIAEAYRAIFDSPDTVVIPNVLGINPQAREALWKGLENGKSLYMPIVPQGKGFKSVTIYDPDAAKVASLLKKRGYSEGGPTSSIIVPTLEAEAAEAGRGSVARSGTFGTALGDLLPPGVKGKGKLAGAALLPSGSAGQDASAAPPLFTWEGAGRHLGLGLRSVLEGGGRAISAGMGDPGRVMSDWMELPKPDGDMERILAGAISGTAEAMTGAAGGAGLARKALSPLWRGVGQALADAPGTSAFLGGPLGGVDGYGDEARHAPGERQGPR